MNTLVLEMKPLKIRVQTSATHTQLHVATQTYLQMIATHRYLPHKAGGSYMYLTVILTSEFTKPTSYISD